MDFSVCLLWLELRWSLHYVRENKNAPSEMNSFQCAFFTRILHLICIHIGEVPRKFKLLEKANFLAKV